MFDESKRRAPTLRAFAAGVAAWALAGAAVGGVVGGLAVRTNTSLQGVGQAGPFLLLAAAAYGVVLALAGLGVSLVARRARDVSSAFAASFVSALAGFGVFSASQFAIASMTWRDDDNALNFGLALAAGFAAALVVRVVLGRFALRRVSVPLVCLSGVASAAVALTSLGTGRIETLVPAPKLDVAHRADGSLPRVMVIGVDGLDWSKLRPLMAEGRLPNFAKLCERGYAAELRTQRPTWSPIVWNTIATGVDETKHGVTDFTEVQLPGLERGVERTYPKLWEPALLPRDVGLAALFELAVARGWVSELAISGLHRRAKAFWNILGEQGVQVGVIRWWATWPAEQVNGWFVSDNDPLMQVLASSKSHSATVNATVDHYSEPPELGAELLPKLAAQRDATRDPFAHPILADLTHDDRAQIEAEPMTTLWFQVIERGDRFATDCALHLWNEKKAPLVAVYLRAVDNLSHRMWSYTGVVDNTYEFTDGLVGELVAAAGESTTIVLVSDHGWCYVPGPTFAHNHAPSGVMILAGPDVAAGAPASGAPTPHVLDVAPTILALYGVPPSAELAGRPWREAFRAGSPAALERAPIATFGTYRPRWGGGGSTRAAQKGREDAVELLRHLGYLD